MGKRDSSYYRERLRREHPTIYSALMSGKYTSVRQAAAAAGLIHLPTRLQALRREWNRASTAERRDFLTWVKASGGTARGASKPIADPGGRLTGPAKAFIQGWLTRNRVTAGQVMKAIGRSNYDYRLAEALHTGKALPKDVVDDLAVWTRRFGF